MLKRVTVDRLRIIHCFRSPVGGIFRHVRDLIHEQVRLGHDVGVICDNNTGGAFEEDNLKELEPALKLGLHRLPMDRSIGPRDLLVLRSLYRTIKALDVNVLHSHGAKGGAYARLIGSRLGKKGKRPARLYCPHGGSIHYDSGSIAGKVYFGLERFLERFTDRLIFVSRYEQSGYLEKVGMPACPTTLVRNGLQPAEFELVSTHSDAADFIYIGMMRDLKGVDLFLDALEHAASATDQALAAVLVGDGPDLERYKERATRLPANVSVKFHDPMPARQAFGLGKTLVVPSRAESMPYIVLEALAARRPMIATRVGGIPEIFGPFHRILVKPDDVEALSQALQSQVLKTGTNTDWGALRARIQTEFSVQKMTSDVMQAYGDALTEG